LVSSAGPITAAVGADGTVELRPGAGLARRLVPLWLRENCPCPECTAPGGQRIVDVTAFPADLRPADVRLVADALEIGWPDGHTSTYPMPGLLAGPEPDRLPRPEPWDAGTALGDPFDALDLAADPAHLAACLEAVHSSGVALVRGAEPAPGALEGIVGLFGHVRETNYGRLFDVRTVIGAENLAYTGLGLPPHTDNPYRDPTPGIQLLHCIRADEGGGGETTLVDGLAAAERLRRADRPAYDLLAATEIGFRYRGSGVDLRARFPVLRLGADGEVAEVRWNTRSCEPFDFGPRLARAYYGAYAAFGRLLADPLLARRLRLRPGDVLVMDNLRVLHGRTRIESPGERHLQGCYADRDGPRSRLRTLLEADDEGEGPAP
jgi:gamma-butyrobetaine dioxygenase